MKPAEVKSATASTEGNAAKPEKTSRPAVIPEMTTSERILSASRTLKENAKDEAARKVLIEAVEFAPDVEASLAAYMLGSCGSGHPDVMVAIGQQMSVRTGFRAGTHVRGDVEIGRKSRWGHDFTGWPVVFEGAGNPDDGSVCHAIGYCRRKASMYL